MSKEKGMHWSVFMNQSFGHSDPSVARPLRAYREERTYEGQPIKDRVAEMQACAYCQEMKAKGETFYPPHFASRRCASGGYPHCTCGTCF